MSYEIVDEGPEKLVAHECNLPVQNTIGGRSMYPEKTIICCTECGKYWWLWYDPNTNVYAEGRWKKVRWYHYGLRKRINGH